MEFAVTVKRNGNVLSVWRNPDGRIFCPKDFTVTTKTDLKVVRDYMKEAYNTVNTRGLADIFGENIPMLWFVAVSDDKYSLEGIFKGIYFV